MDRRLDVPLLRQSLAGRATGPCLPAMGLAVPCLFCPGFGTAGGSSIGLCFPKKAPFAPGPDAGGGPDPGPYIYALVALSCAAARGTGAVLGGKNSGIDTIGAFCLGAQDGRALAAGRHVSAATPGCGAD